LLGGMRGRRFYFRAQAIRAVLGTPIRAWYVTVVNHRSIARPVGYQVFSLGQLDLHQLGLALIIIGDLEMILGGLGLGFSLANVLAVDFSASLRGRPHHHRRRQGS
jgi:hypothetical protein